MTDPPSARRRRRNVYVVRHAKSSWDDRAITDHDRPLAARGRRAADRLARYASDSNIRPDLVLCSSATRATQTFERIASGLGDDAEVRFERSLYGATAEELLERLHAVPVATSSVMLIGHNPGVQDLVLLLVRGGPLRARLAAKFPTGALATLDVSRSGWKDLRKGGAELIDFVVPKAIDVIRST